MSVLSGLGTLEWDPAGKILYRIFPDGTRVMVYNANMVLDKYSETVRLESGETKTVKVPITKSGTIVSLSPKSDEGECMGTLGVPRKCVVVAITKVEWNVKEEQAVTAPFDVEAKITFAALKGDFYGVEEGQPAAVGKNHRVTVLVKTT